MKTRAGIVTHPVEVVGRIRQHPEGNDQESAIKVVSHSRVSVWAEGISKGRREFSLDGVSDAAVENLQAFYAQFVEPRVQDVKAGGRCTILMYGPTGAGKSYTMFGAADEKGVMFHALLQLMRRADADDSDKSGDGSVEVRATVWEIYNEVMYDLLAPKPKGSNAERVNLDKCPTKSILERDPQKLLEKILTVVGKRKVRSTNCNAQSSRSHCIITIDVPEVGGKMILVDMAGSENIMQAGVRGASQHETGKINEGNGALKRVVEAIANKDPYIPYRDSKLTTFLKDSFEHKSGKILMVLCASPAVKDSRKTLCTLEYGAKAKSIVHLQKLPPKDKQVQPEIAQVLKDENRQLKRKIEELQSELEVKDNQLKRLKMKMPKVTEWREQAKLQGKETMEKRSLNSSKKVQREDLRSPTVSVFGVGLANNCGSREGVGNKKRELTKKDLPQIEHVEIEEDAEDSPMMVETSNDVEPDSDRQVRIQMMYDAVFKVKRGGGIFNSIQKEKVWYGAVTQHSKSTKRDWKAIRKKSSLGLEKFSAIQIRDRFEDMKKRFLKFKEETTYWASTVLDKDMEVFVSSMRAGNITWMR